MLSKADTLSGLSNRRSLQDALRKEYKLRGRAQDRGSNDNFCLCLFDIDHFKTINDSQGHLAGDQIKAFAIGDKRMRLTASAGVSCSEECRSVNRLIEKADERLYTSKRSGRDQAT